MKLPMPCPKCDAPIYNYILACSRCGHTWRKQFATKDIGFTLKGEPPEIEAPKPSKTHYFD